MAILTLNGWKYAALQLLSNSNSFDSLNDVERAAYIEYLTLTPPVNRTISGLRLQFFNTINNVVYTGPINDVIRNSMRDALTGIYENASDFNALQYEFWKAVAEGRLVLGGAPWVATFNGTDQRIDFPNRNISVPSGILIEFIAHIKTTDTNQGILSVHSDDIAQYMYLSVTSGGFLKLNTNSHTPSSGTITINDGEWHKVVMQIHTGTGLYTAYVDDVFDYTDTHNDPTKLVGVFNVTAACEKRTNSGAPANYFSGIVADFGLVADGSPQFFAAIDDGWAVDPEIHQDIITYKNDGTESYDTSTKTFFDYETTSDPKYGNVAADKAEAIARAREGTLIRNADFRNDAADWIFQVNSGGSISGNVMTLNTQATSSRFAISTFPAAVIPTADISYELEVDFECDVAGEGLECLFPSTGTVFARATEANTRETQILTFGTTSVSGNTEIVFASSLFNGSVTTKIYGLRMRPVTNIWVSEEPHLEDGEMINGTEPMWTQDPTKPSSPVFNIGYTIEYGLEYTH